MMRRMVRWLLVTVSAVGLLLLAIATVAKTRIDCATTVDVYEYVACAVAHPKLWLQCRTKWDDPAEVDWQYVRTKVASTLNRRWATDTAPAIQQTTAS